jgi:hypothetical protein
MTDANRKRKLKTKEATDCIGDECLIDSIDHTLVFGPVVTNPLTEGWYFTISSAGKEGFRVDQIVTADADFDMAIAWRNAIKMALMINRRPLVVHDCDDELYMARLCETLWPGEKITALRKALEAERATWS